MKFGLYVFAGNPPRFHRPDAERYRAALEQSTLAEALGFDFIWVAEHHFDPLTTPNPFILCAAIAARTRTIRIGTSIAIAPLHHPAALAENAAMLDVISNGRFDLGLGVGYERREFDTFGVSLKSRGSRMEEALQIIKGLWTASPFSFHGRHYVLEQLELHPKPVQQPHPPLWMAADKRSVDGTIPPPLARAARYGCHLCGPSDPTLLRLYEEALTANGFNPREHYRSCFRTGFVAESRTRAWEDYAPHVLIQLEDYLKAYAGSSIHAGTANDGNLPSARALPALADAGEADFLGKPFAVGTPEDAAAAVRAAQRLGITHYVIWMHIGGIDPSKAERSMRLFAEEVIPRFKDR